MYQNVSLGGRCCWTQEPNICVHENSASEWCSKQLHFTMLTSCFLANPFSELSPNLAMVSGNVGQKEASPLTRTVGFGFPGCYTVWAHFFPLHIWTLPKSLFVPGRKKTCVRYRVFVCWHNSCSWGNVKKEYHRIQVNSQCCFTSGHRNTNTNGVFGCLMDKSTVFHG